MPDQALSEKNKITENELSEGAGVYEVGYHVIPTVGEDGLSTEVGNIRSAIEDNGGSVFAEEWPKHMDLSYPISKDIDRKRYKFDKSFFGWMKFESLPEVSLKVRESLSPNSHILRFVIVKSIKEEARRRQRFFTNTERSENKGKTSDGSDDAKPMSKADMDQEIERLVVE